MSFSEMLYWISDHNPKHEIANLEVIELMRDAGYEDFIRMLFEDILREEVSLDNIEYVGSGSTTLALKVKAPNGKGYVIKIGSEREHFDIPYSENIIQPFIREQIPIKDGRFFTVEVQREAKVQEEFGMEVVTEGHDVGKVVMNLRKENIEWDDPGTLQVGILAEDDRNERRISAGFGGYTDNGGLDKNGYTRSSFVEDCIEGGYGRYSYSKSEYSVDVIAKENKPSHVVVDTDKLHRRSSSRNKGVDR